MPNPSPNMIHCGGCGATFDASNPDEAAQHVGHDDIKIEQA